MKVLRFWLLKILLVLELLCVLPEYQRIGIGSAFLKWGIEKADASNARIYLEATMEGVPAYLKHGWKVVEEIQLDYTERGGEGRQKFALMIREPQETGAWHKPLSSLCMYRFGYLAKAGNKVFWIQHGRIVTEDAKSPSRGGAVDQLSRLLWRREMFV